jgi:hypothetical protein
MLWWHWVLVVVGAVSALLIIIRLIGGEGVILGILEVIGEVLGGIADDD